MSVDTDADVQHRRATVRPDKAETVAELTEAFRGRPRPCSPSTAA
jgi:hypothetical protein